MSSRLKDERTSPEAGLHPEETLSDIRKIGYLRKLKKMRKKFFVLRIESKSGPARLEYYDNEKKWKSGSMPKRCITIKTCFNINRKLDSKQKHVIALYTKDDCFSVVTESDTELEEWLNAMLELQHGNGNDENLKPKPKFEHVWQVSVKGKGLGNSKNITGHYRLCLTVKNLSLVKMDPHSDKPTVLEFPLMSIRRCGHTDCFFFMELGRSAITGAGEIWMLTEDVLIAQNMHEVILGAMKACREHEDMGPLSRPRSASTSENSKPIQSRRPIAVVNPQSLSSSAPRDRCDSMPSRPRTISEGQGIGIRPYYASPTHPLDSLRPQSSYGRTMSYSPPGFGNILSPSSVGCSTDSAGSSLSIDEFDGLQSDFTVRYPHSLPTENALHTEPTISEEPVDDYLSMSCLRGLRDDHEAYLNMTPLFIETLSKQTSPPSAGSGDYLEMMSPASLPEGYMFMNPVGSGTIAASGTSPPHRIGGFGDHSLFSASEGPDGYVPMAPGQNVQYPNVSKHEGYLDMSPLSSSLPKSSGPKGASYIEFSCPRTSSHSLLDSSKGSSPSSFKLEEFHLDKVKSYFSPSEDDSEDYIKPVRAYSMGSRPLPRKTHLTISADPPRVRAYSVGSRGAPNIKREKDPVEVQLGSLKCIDAVASKKSSSAPQLPSKTSYIKPSSCRTERNEDLMEIDYDKPKSEPENKESGGSRQRSGSYSAPISSISEISEQVNNSNNKISVVKSGQEIRIPPGHDYMGMISKKDIYHKHKAMKDKESFRVGQESENNKTTTSTKFSRIIAPGLHPPIYPPGDYVTLDPSCNYAPVTVDLHAHSGKITKFPSNVVSSQVQKLSQLPNLEQSPLTQQNVEDVKTDAKFVLSDASCLSHTLPDVKPVTNPSQDYFPMSAYSKQVPEMKLSHKASNSAQTTSHPEIQPSDHPVSPNIKLDANASIFSSSGSKNKVFTETHCSSKQHSPFPHELKLSEKNIENKTHTTLPSVASNPVLNARKESSGSAVGSHSAPTSRPSSIISDHGDQGLNYASLDLISSGSENFTNLAAQSSILGADTKEEILCYAEIDFVSSQDRNLNAWKERL